MPLVTKKMQFVCLNSLRKQHWLTKLCACGAGPPQTSLKLVWKQSFLQTPSGNESIA